MSDPPEVSPTLGELYDLLTEVQRKRAFFFLFQVVEFYADSDTWFATTLLTDPPCGSIAHDYHMADDDKVRPGGRARIAFSWILSMFARVGGLPRHTSTKRQT